MSHNNLLVVLVDDDLQPELRHEIEGRPEPVEGVHVVAPTKPGALHWLATDEGEARSEAAARGIGAEWSLAHDIDVAGEVGETDPLLAVEDALQTFPADEILLVEDPERDDGLETSLQRYGLPVTRVPSATRPARHAPWREAVRSLVGGRSDATPFVAFVGANVALFVLAALISVVALIAFLVAR
jgi:hypothetical protein